MNGMLASIGNFMMDAVPFTQIPWLGEWWRKNRVAVALRGSTGITFLNVVAECIAEWKQKKEVEPGEKDG